MPQLTGNEVLRAARDFAERGIEPTQIPVRAHLGHRGSYTTISRGLRTWRAAQYGQVKEARVHSEMLEHNFDRYDAKSKKAVAGLQKELAHERDTVRLLRQRADQDAATVAELREKLAQAEARSPALIQTAPAQPGPALPTSADPNAGALRVD
jgi:seryl-tRNA synthetase